MGHTLGKRSMPVWTILGRLGDGDLRVSFFKRDGARDKKRVERLPFLPCYHNRLHTICSSPRDALGSR